MWGFTRLAPLNFRRTAENQPKVGRHDIHRDWKMWPDHAQTLSSSTLVCQSCPSVAHLLDRLYLLCATDEHWICASPRLWRCRRLLACVWLAGVWLISGTRLDVDEQALAQAV
jgi:hypothetical protein